MKRWKWGVGWAIQTAVYLRAILFFAFVSTAAAQGGGTALDALKLIPKDAAKRLARIEAREGTPAPERWYLLVHDPAEQRGDWLSYGRGWDEQRYSPLDQINDGNVQQLGLAWYVDLETFRGVQASPLVIDGILYNETIYNVVTAYDGRTGAKLWTYVSTVHPPPDRVLHRPSRQRRSTNVPLLACPNAQDERTMKALSPHAPA